jgi:hypothetical protein
MMREYALSMKAGADPDAEIVLDRGASSHFLTPATVDQIQLVPCKGGPTSIEVAPAKEEIDFAATEFGSAGGLSRVLVSDELGADTIILRRRGHEAQEGNLQAQVGPQGVVATAACFS